MFHIGLLIPSEKFENRSKIVAASISLPRRGVLELRIEIMLFWQSKSISWS